MKKTPEYAAKCLAVVVYARSVVREMERAPSDAAKLAEVIDDLEEARRRTEELLRDLEDDGLRIVVTKTEASS